MSDQRQSAPPADGSSKPNPDASPQEQAAPPSQQPRRLDMNGWLTHLQGAMPPPPYSNAGNIIRPTPRRSLPLRQPGTASGARATRQPAYPWDLDTGLDPNQQTSLGSLPASRYSSAAAAAPTFPALLQLFPPHNLANIRSTASDLGPAARRDPSASPREGTPATPLPRQLSGAGTPREPWETPPRRSRSRPRPDHGLMDLATAAESLSHSLPMESTGNLNPSAGTPRARTDRSQAAAGLPDRTRSVTSSRARPTKRMPSPSQPRRLPRAATARARASADPEARLTRSTESEDIELSDRHPGVIRALTLDMIARGSSYGAAARKFKIEESLVETWAKDRRKGPRIPNERGRASARLNINDPSHDEKRRRAMEMFDQGYRFSEVMNSLNIPRGTLNGWRYGKQSQYTSRKPPRVIESPADNGTTVTDGSHGYTPISSVEREMEPEPPPARAARPADSGGRGSGRPAEATRAEREATQDPNWPEQLQAWPPEAAAAAAPAAATASMPASTDIPGVAAGPHKPRKDPNRVKRPRFTAEIRAEAVRLYAQGTSSADVAHELSAHGVKAHNVLNWISLKRKGTMNDQGHRYYAKSGWVKRAATVVGAQTEAYIAAGNESDTTEEGEIWERDGDGQKQRQWQREFGS